MSRRSLALATRHDCPPRALQASSDWVVLAGTRIRVKGQGRNRRLMIGWSLDRGQPGPLFFEFIAGLRGGLVGFLCQPDNNSDNSFWDPIPLAVPNWGVRPLLSVGARAMLNHPMRSRWLVATFLVALVAASGCGSVPERNGAASATKSPSSTSSSTPASGSRLTSPSPVACKPSANTRSLTGPVAAYFWSGPDGCTTVTLINSTGQISTVTTTRQHATQFVCQDSSRSQPSPHSGLTPGPAYSVTNDRLYWWDGHLIRWLSRDGTQGSFAVEVGDQVGLEFATSPDDSRIVMTTIDFAKWPLHRTTWIEDAATRANKTVIFEADLSTDPSVLANGTSAGWPWSWQASRPVLYDFPLCLTLGGDQFIALSFPRVVDPSTGNRLVSLPKCYGAALTTGGGFCTASFTARSLDWYDWTGKQINSWALPQDTEACDADPNPSRSRVLAYCSYNIYRRASPGLISQQFLFGSGPSLPRGIAQPVSLRWLDDDLILESRTLSDPAGYRSAIYIWSLSRQAVVAGPITIPGWYNSPRQWFRSAPPPTRLLA